MVAMVVTLSIATELESKEIILPELDIEEMQEFLDEMGHGRNLGLASSDIVQAMELARTQTTLAAGCKEVMCMTGQGITAGPQPATGPRG